MATAATKVGPKFQVTIPKNVRDAVGLKVGDLEFRADLGCSGCHGYKSPTFLA